MPQGRELSGDRWKLKVLLVGAAHPEAIIRAALPWVVGVSARPRRAITRKWGVQGPHPSPPARMEPRDWSSCDHVA